MTEENKELLIKDLCARLPYGVKLQKTYEECGPLELRSIDIDNDKLVVYKYKGEVLTICDADSIERFGQIKYKPYLFPLSSMTEEQKEEIEDKLIFPSNSNGGWIEILCNDEYDIPFCFIDFCNKNYLDYRGLIPMGLALDATGLNIY